jgi:AraC-like DNA-binding protein
MSPSPDSGLAVRIERSRSVLRVVGSTLASNPDVTVEISFSGGPEGIWFRLTQAGQTRVFPHDVVASHRPMSAILRLIADEVDLSKPPSDVLLGLLMRSLILYTSRMSNTVPLPRWGRPIRDRRIERALEILDGDLSKYWTVELLARRVGLSRPAFARQFLRMVHLSPMRYLTRRRMRRSAELLLESDASIAEVAALVGYQSEFAFNRAFKRYHQLPPGVYRQQHARVCGFAIRNAA